MADDALRLMENKAQREKRARNEFLARRAAMLAEAQEVNADKPDVTAATAMLAGLQKSFQAAQTAAKEAHAAMLAGQVKIEVVLERYVREKYRLHHVEDTPAEGGADAD